MNCKFWIRRIFSKVYSATIRPKTKQTSHKLSLLPLEDRIVPAVPFSPAFPHALSITPPSGNVTSSANFTVTFNQPVIGVDAADFQLVTTGTVAGGTISSVTGSGDSYTVSVTGITGTGTLGVNLVDLPTITALPSFAAQQTFATGTSPRSVTLGDVNGDGRLDIVTANLNSNTASVLLGNGNGTFQAEQTFDTGTGTFPFSVTLGDVNGDGRLDIVTGNPSPSTASVLLGNGNGTFQTQQTFATGTGPQSVALGDVNGDGRLDIVTANTSSNNASVLLGNGNGTFQTQQTFATGNNPTSVTLGDVNGDGRLDIVTATFSSNTASVLLGNGNGTFQGQQSFATSAGPLSVTLGDVNGDGRLDIVTGNPGSQNASVLLGNGNGTFQTRQTFAAGTSPRPVTLGDVNGDGRLDIVTANYNIANTVSVLLGNGNGTFQTQQSFATGTTPYSVTLGDVNSDGRLDIITANRTSNNASVILGTGGSSITATFSPQQTFATGTYPRSVTLGDVNGDGRLDIVTANRNSNNASVLLGNGNGTFQTQQTFATGTSPQSVTLGDVNGDGRLDIVTANSTSNASVLLGNGNGTFQTQQTFSTGPGTSPKSVTLGDVNGDGRLDIVTCHFQSHSVSVLLGNGNGTFQTQQTYAMGTNPRSVTLGDVNGDGRLDIVTANSGSQNASVRLGNGNGTFQAEQTFAAGTGVFSVTLGDVNGDGRLDIVIANYTPGHASVLLGNGNGTFQTRQTFATGTATNPVSVTLGDVNGDGRLDIVTANKFSYTASVLLGNGNGTFQGQKTFKTGNRPYSVTLGDVNGDGRLDIVTANYITSTVSVLLNSLAFTGQAAPTSTALSSSANPSVFGESVTFTATVTGTAGTPTGTVTFKDGSTQIGSPVNLVNGVAILSTSSLTVGSSHSITAEYSGDSSNQASTSSAVTQVVNQAGTTTNLTSSANPSVFGESVTFTATVSAASPGSGTPTGTVTFFDGATQIGTGTLTGGVGTFSTTSLAVGSSHSITVVYAGDTNFLTSTSSPISQTVNLAPTITSVNQANFVLAQPGTFTVTATGFPTPTFSITSGTLPQGLTFTSNGLLSGTPATGTFGTYPLTITASNGVNPVGTQNFTLNVTLAPAPLVTGSAPPTGNDPANPGNSVNLYDTQTGQPNGVAVPFPNFMGQIRVAAGDFNQDGKSEIVAAAGPGGGPAVTIMDSQTGVPRAAFFAYDPAFTGGVFVAVKDINNDGVADIVTGAGSGGGPHVKVFNGVNLQEIRSFFAYAETFTGGVTVGTADMNGDNILDLVTGAGPGGGPHVKVFDGATNALISSWFAYPVNFTGGVFVGMGDISNDGNVEVVTGAGQGGGPVVAVWNPNTGQLLSQFMAYAPQFSGGVRVGVIDATGDGINDLATGAGPGGGPHVKAFNYPNLDLLFEFFSGPESNRQGVFVS